MTVNHFINMSKVLLTFQEMGFLCDTILKARDKELKAHSVILSAVSPFFSSAVETADRTNKMYYIDVSVFDSTTINIALHFIYTGNLLLPSSLIRMDNLPDLFATLNRLGLGMSQLNGCE